MSVGTVQTVKKRKSETAACEDVGYTYGCVHACAWLLVWARHTCKQAYARMHALTRTGHTHT